MDHNNNAIDLFQYPIKLKDKLKIENYICASNSSIGKFEKFLFDMVNCKMLIKVWKATTMCIYVAHRNIFMLNKHDLQKKQKKNTVYFKSKTNKYF